MAVETQVLAGHSSSGELVRSIDWKGAFWVASGVPALVLFFNWRHRRYDWKTRISGRGPSVEDNSRWQRRRVVASTTFSRHLMKSLAMALVQPAFTRVGTELVVHDGGDLRATIVQMPFYDPMRLRTHPLTERK